MVKGILSEKEDLEGESPMSETEEKYKGYRDKEARKAYLRRYMRRKRARELEAKIKSGDYVPRRVAPEPFMSWQRFKELFPDSDFKDYLKEKEEHRIRVHLQPIPPDEPFIDPKEKGKSGIRLWGDDEPKEKGEKHPSGELLSDVLAGMPEPKKSEQPRTQHLKEHEETVDEFLGEEPEQPESENGEEWAEEEIEFEGEEPEPEPEEGENE